MTFRPSYWVVRHGYLYLSRQYFLSELEAWVWARKHLPCSDYKIRKVNYGSQHYPYQMKDGWIEAINEVLREKGLTHG